MRYDPLALALPASGNLDNFLYNLLWRHLCPWIVRLRRRRGIRRRCISQRHKVRLQLRLLLAHIRETVEIVQDKGLVILARR